MKFFSILFSLVLCFVSGHSSEPLYKSYQTHKEGLPHLFRELSFPSFTVSASEQPSLDNLENLKALHPDKTLTVIDLRGEFHGLEKGHPVDWKVQEAQDGYTINSFQYNDGISAQELYELEESLLMQENHCFSEKTVLEQKLGAAYVRFPLKDHGYLSDEQVDSFLELIEKLPSDAWIHVHCAGGKGRTGVVLCMLDMIHHALTVSVKEIMERHTRLGASELYQPHASEDSYRKKRYDFLALFYEYCQETASSKQTWSSWLKSRQSAS